MDPPLVNEAPFSATDNPPSYSLAELLSFSMSGRGGSGLRTGGDSLGEESTETEHSGSSGGNGGEKRKMNYAKSFDDDSSKLISSCTANSGLNKSNIKQTKAPRVRDENGELKNENSGTNVKQEEKSKNEPTKDYIHVRARRGQATDSHSLAERARREKISERMKILQDLVPGCNKVIGKALVLDEIINYIQSLHQQVEFLSMKLEAVNSRLNPALEGYPSKDLISPTFDVNGMLYRSQTPREYARGTQAEWLHMQVGSGFQRAN